MNCLRQRSRRTVAHAALASSAGLICFAAGAQIAPPVQVIDEGLRRQVEREREQQEALAPRAHLLAPRQADDRPPELPDERPCSIIREIVFVGPDAARFRWLDAAAAPFVDRCIGADGLGRVIAWFNASLISQGLVTSRVSLGPQNLAQGRLELRLDTGRIAEIRMVGPDKRPDDRWGTWVNAFPTTAGRLLDARDLEQGVEQMKRLPSQSVTTTVEPGDQPNTSILIIERQTGGFTDRLHGGLTLDNSGSATLGRTQLSGNLALDNALGLNDLAALSLNTNAEQPSADHRGQSFAFNYSVPFGFSTFSANASHSRFAQNVQLTTASTLSSGESDTVELKWQHTVVRTASAKAGVYASVSTRRASSYLDDVELLVQRRKTTFIETGVAFRQIYAGDASVDLELGYRRGMPWLSAQDDLPSIPDADQPPLTVRPRLWLLNASTTIPFEWARAWQYRAQVRAQKTHDRTLSIDQIGIGGRGSVRGFDGDSVLLAESGWTLRNELTTDVSVAGLAASAYLGVDIGRVWGPSAANLIGHRLIGAAVGTRLQRSAWQLDLALATPIAKPDGFKTAWLNPYASLSCAF